MSAATTSIPKKMTLERINKIITEVADNYAIKPEDIKPHHSLRDDVCMDSMDQFETAYHLEEEFDILIPDEEIVAFKTVRDVYAAVLSATGDHTMSEKGKLIDQAAKWISDNYRVGGRRNIKQRSCLWHDFGIVLTDKFFVLTEKTFNIKIDKDTEVSEIDTAKDFYRLFLRKKYVPRQI